MGEAGSTCTALEKWGSHELREAATRYAILRRWWHDEDASPSQDELNAVFRTEALADVVAAAHGTLEPGKTLHRVLRCSLDVARKIFNEILIKMLTTYHSACDRHLYADESTISGAGRGLFTFRTIEEGETICYYSGVVETFSSKSKIKDASFLCFAGYCEEFDEDIWVDPAPVEDIKARFINDPLDESLCNARWHVCPRESSFYRCGVVATRTIEAGEEIFLSYGTSYWDHSNVEKRYAVSKPEKIRVHSSTPAASGRGPKIRI